MNESVIEAIRSEAKRFFLQARPSHGWDHVERVYNLGMHIGEIEKADLYIVGAAAYLHDIARNAQDVSNGSICHAEHGTRMAREILKNYSIDESYIDQICHCVETHSFKNKKEPSTIEAKVIYDADKLDSIGAVGIGRAFYFANELGAVLHIPDLNLDNTKPYTADDCCYREYLQTLQYLKDKMLTGVGTRIAQGRHDLMEGFFNHLNLEYKGLA